MPQGIAVKLIIYLTLMVIVVEGGFALINIDSQEKQLLNEMTLNAEMASQTLVSTTWNAMLEDRREAVYQMMENVGHQESIDRVRIYNKAGEIMFSTGTDQGEIVDVDAEACDMCHAKDQPLVNVDVPSRMRVYERATGGRMLGMVTPIYNERSCSTADCHAHPAERKVLGVIDVTMPLDRVDRDLADLRLRSLMFSSISVLVVAFFVILFTRRFVQRPVHELIEATKLVGSGGADHPLNTHAEGELGELARSFERMRERLHESDRRVRDFTETLERQVEERTQRLHEAEKKLIQSDRLASLGHLAASVAHEINNPLGGVLNFGKLMQRIAEDDEIPSERLPDFRRYLEHVVHETERCGNIVRDLLVFARHSEHSLEPHDFNAIVRRTLSVINHRLELGEVKPELELAEDLPKVVCDSSQVQQIVINLVLNAAEAMQDGVVTVRTRLEPGGDFVRLEVQDTGSGISREDQAKIFDPFFSTKAEGQGTGLGLAVVYGIVEAHGGTIDVKSAAGEGTTFLVCLPTAQEQTDGGDGVPPAAR